ncbi:hypothetical protein PR202_ga03695 [Eleusine coracana subsp. coracana]|uniref:4-hydroxy-7-methoxy-3-oxo-3,4-dihydro-2H-1,4-benzoxazin-2-yl glucosidebeta-D-glucosidase n=1 Tax=Eleusine coracana subsp. coracana TaxID=191504 RepID=A0AAV5BP81_ELECO|nr:hypothetical protein PR202_ga03695 [Eleusine coracana subsp. coracana]
MALLVTTSALTATHSAQTSLGRKEGRPNSVSWHISPATRGYTLSVRSRAARITSDLGVEALKPSKQDITKKSFPPGFVFGAGTSSYQIEGAWNEDGKGPSIWDHYCHTYPDKIKFRHNGDVAVNSYHMYEEDVKMLKAMGMGAYRGNAPRWGKSSGYQLLQQPYQQLLENGIKPYVTLFHWETPQALEDEYRSFLSPRIVNDFKDFAEVCFKNFGDRVKHWITFNEPYVFCCNAYGIGKHAPGRCSPGNPCAVPTGDSLAEPYQAGHNLLLAHAEAARLYKKKYQEHQEGQIGIALVSMGYEPFDKTNHVHSQARDRSIDHNLGWFLEPLYRGDYPFSMRSLIRDRLPNFTPEEKAKLQGSYDMLGLNYYTSRFSRHVDYSPLYSPTQYKDDAYAEVGIIGADGQHIGEDTGTGWLCYYPEGLKNLLMVIRDRYGNPPIYITENGVGDQDEGDLSMDNAVNDDVRLNYLNDHIAVVKESIDMGSKVRGHFTWSLLDNFEWQNGFTHRFGLIYVDYNDNLKRHMKNSAKWFSKFNGVDKKDTQVAAGELSNGVPKSN